MSSILDQDIQFLPSVGTKTKEILSKELGIRSYGDLLEYYPYKYVDRSKIFHISELTSDMPFVQLKGKILSYEEVDIGKRNKMLVAHFSDGYGVVDLVWFRSAQYIIKSYKVGTEYIVFGKPSAYNGRFRFAHPDIDDASKLQISEMGMQPFYGLTENMKKRGYTSRSIERITRNLVSILPPLPETLPDFIVNRLHLVSRDAALRMIHYPHSHQEMQKAQEEGKELFILEAALLTEPVYREMLDEIWYIHVPQEIRMERLRSSRGYSDEKMYAVFANQPSEETFTAVSDLVIENGGTFEETEKQIDLALGRG